MTFLPSVYIVVLTSTTPRLAGLVSLVYQISSAVLKDFIKLIFAFRNNPNECLRGAYRIKS